MYLHYSDKFYNLTNVGISKRNCEFKKMWFRSNGRQIVNPSTIKWLPRLKICKKPLKHCLSFKLVTDQPITLHAASFSYIFFILLADEPRVAVFFYSVCIQLSSFAILHYNYKGETLVTMWSMLVSPFCTCKKCSFY